MAGAESLLYDRAAQPARGTRPEPHLVCHVFLAFVGVREAVAVPGRLQRAAAGKEVDQRHIDSHIGSRNTHQRNGSRQITSVESLLPGFRPTDRVDYEVGAESVGELLDRLPRVELADTAGLGRS